MQALSFSYNVKQELSRISSNACCQKAEMASLMRMAGTIKIIGGQNKRLLQIQTVHAPTARRIFKLLRKHFDFQAEIAVKRNSFLKNRSLYIIALNLNECLEMLKETGILGKTEGDFVQRNSFNPKIIKKRCCKGAFLRGAFLGSGSISNPKGSYHMEFVTADKDMSNALNEVINSFGINSRIVERKSNYMIYLKDGNQIADMLGIIGAHNSLLKFEDIRVLKNMRNSVNRMVNCETANLNKTIDASVRQIECINYLREHKLFDELPKNLKQVAELRLEYPDLSLKELGQMLDPTLSKSGVNYRLNKIEKTVENLQLKKGE